MGSNEKRDKTKPFGIILISIYSSLYIVPMLGLTVLLLPILSAMSAPIWELLKVMWFMAIAVLSAASVYGLWTIQKWALKLTFWLHAASAVFSILFIFPIFPGDEFTWGGTVLSLVSASIDVAILFYLMRLDIHYLYHGNYNV